MENRFDIFHCSASHFLASFPFLFFIFFIFIFFGFFSPFFSTREHWIILSMVPNIPYFVNPLVVYAMAEWT